ncbi:MAG: MmgE/PrpD family protein [Oligoflexia bacterium]|nr:MmgE/PrpD family protein [Oligoflexia bacterium]
MTTTLQGLARWADQLESSDIPPRVLERVRLQHLGIGAAIRATAAWPLQRSLASLGQRRGAAALAFGGRASRRDAARVHAALAVFLQYDDWLLGGHLGAAAVPVAWAFAGKHSTAEIVRATVAANEVAGRVGASLLLGSGRPRRDTVISSLAAATTAGLLSGLSASQLAHAMALACVGAARLSWRTALAGDASAALAHGAAVVAGLDAVALARIGTTGPQHVLDARGGLLETLSPAPLRAAFTGLGRAWLTDTLAYATDPVALSAQVPLQAVAEILARHVKAADRPLRWDQIQGIEIDVAAPTIGLHLRSAGQVGCGPVGWTLRIPQAVGRLVATQVSPGAFFDPDAGQRVRDAAAAVAQRVTVRHSWGRTVKLVEHLVDVLGPLFAGLTLAELRAVRSAWRPPLAMSGTSLPAASDLVDVLRARPDRLLDRLRYQSGDLADASLDQLQVRLGVDLRLYTTRGGSWPEHRDIPSASPGWPWEDTVRAVLAKWTDPRQAAPVGLDLDLGPARSLLSVGDGASASEWAQALLSIG